MLRLHRRSFLRGMGLTAGAVTLTSTGVASAVEGNAAVRSLESARTPLMLARVWVDRSNSHLIGDFDDTHNVFDDGSVELLLWPGDLGRLAATGLRYEITVTDLAARDAELDAKAPARSADLPVQPGETANGQYRTLAQHNADMQRLATQNPDICALFTLPFKSLQGRTIYGLEIAEKVTKRDGRPVFYNDGVHHAREWPAAEMPIMWAFDLIESYRRATTPGAQKQQHDDRMANIVRYTRNVIVPVVNVDGFDYSRTGPVDNSFAAAPGAGMQYWRKNMRGARVQGWSFNPGVEHNVPNNGVVPTTPGALGVDPNRNYSYRWGGLGSSGSETSETYRGVEPFSEPESRNVQWVHQTYQCIAGITHHTSGNLNLWAWGDTHDDAPDDALLARLGFACGDYNGYRPTKSIDLYVTTGTCSDYTYGTFGSISYTFEHAGNSFHPTYSSVVPQFYANNREALMLLCELVCLEPDQREHMHAALANDFTSRRNSETTVLQHLTGAFEENISNTDYVYPASNGLDLNGRYHCVITGRLIDAHGGPVAGTVRLLKAFRNTLTPGNPIQKPNWAETMNSSIQTDDDGTFRWVVYPSTQPYQEYLGNKEVFVVRAEVGEGDALRATEQTVYLSRGDVVNLGAIKLP
jgi:murein tripeptide amidase MpaA